MQHPVDAKIGIRKKWETHFVEFSIVLHLAISIPGTESDHFEVVAAFRVCVYLRIQTIEPRCQLLALGTIYAEYLHPNGLAGYVAQCLLLFPKTQVLPILLTDFSAEKDIFDILVRF
jgi:hypothetical protein